VIISVQDGGGTIMKRLILLLDVVTAIAMLSLPGFAQASYTWALSCSPATLGTGVGTGATWLWLHNGIQISSTVPPNGFASCATPPLSGSGAIPASINGIQVNGIEVDLSLSESPAGCDAFATVRKSFDPANPKISISESVSAPAKNSFNNACPKASFHFALK
jgi:hypothetical protein